MTTITIDIMMARSPNLVILIVFLTVYLIVRLVRRLLPFG